MRGGMQNRDAETYTRKDGSTGEFKRKVLKNDDILKITGVEHISAFVERQQTNWIKRCIKSDDSAYIKKLTFADYFKNESKKKGKLSTTYGQVLQIFKNKGKSEEQMINELKS